MKMPKGMNSPKGVFSYKENPLKPAMQTKTRIGGSNPDAQKANKLLQQAQQKNDSLRGRGM